MTESSTDSRLRIAFAVHDARAGGGQDLYALQLVNGLSERHDVTLFARSAAGLTDGVRYEPITTPNRPPSLRAGVFHRKVARRLANTSFDVVHAVGGAFPGAHVVTAQFCQTAWDAIERTTPSKLSGPIERAYRRRQTRTATAHEQRAASAAQALIGVSRAVLTEWTSAYAPPAHHTGVIPNAVDATRLAPDSNGHTPSLRDALRIPGDAFCLLTVGALVRKGIETVIECLVRLPSEVHCIAVGAGPHRRVAAAARAADVAGRLHLVQPTRDVHRYFHAADAFLFPTRYEPFGMVIVEAWAAGLPVISSACAGALEWSRDGETALHVASATDAGAFAHGTRQLMDDRALAERLSTGGRALVSQFSWERVVRETERVYRTILT